MSRPLAGPQFRSLSTGRGIRSIDRRRFREDGGMGGQVRNDYFDIAAEAIVSAALSRQSAFSPVSTKQMLHELRILAPECRASDEELLRLIVRRATGRTMSVIFDHRPSLS